MVESFVQASPPPVSFKPPPPWALAPPFIAPGPPGPNASFDGRCAWLSDTQIIIGRSNQTWLSRTIYEVTSPEGLQAAGHFDTDFDPSYQTLVLHHVRVLRAGATREIDLQAGLQLFQRERDMERAVFDGRLTAHLTVPDVRVGDIVDVCYSIVGANPALRGGFAAEWRLGWACWVGETRVRLISERERPLTLATFNGAPECVTEPLGPDLIVRTWRACATESIQPELSMPSWVRLFPSARACDPLTWAQVADIFREHYAAEPLPDDLEAAAAGIEHRVSNPGEQLVEALRLVQSSLRYQAITLGDGGFVPRSLARIWATRSGDCKDASRLLVALLNRLGVEASPALVNTYVGEKLHEEAPSLAAFDHCIVSAVIDGRRYWLDPTLSGQGGDLETLRQSRLGWALPLVANAMLEDMGQEDPALSIEHHEIYDLPDEVAAPGRVQVTTTYGGWRADGVRQRIAAGLGPFTKALLEPFERRFGSARTLEPLQIQDDLAANQLRLVETYEIGRAWTVGEDGRALFEVVDDFFSPNFPPLSREPRRWPLALGPVLQARGTVELRLPVATPPSEWDTVISMAGLEATSKFMRVDAEARTLRLIRTLDYKRTSIEPSEMGEFIRFCEDAMRHGGLTVRHPVRYGQVVGPPKAKKQSNPWAMIGYTVFALWLIGALIRLLTGTAGP